MVNINDSGTYTGENWELLNRNLALLKWKGRDNELTGRKGFDKGCFSLQFAITFYQPDQDYTYIIDFAKYNSPHIRYAPSHPSIDKSNLYVDYEHLGKLKPTLLGFLKDCVRDEIEPGLECILPPCIFT